MQDALQSGHSPPHELVNHRQPDSPPEASDRVVLALFDQVPASQVVGVTGLVGGEKKRRPLRGERERLGKFRRDSNRNQGAASQNGCGVAANATFASLDTFSLKRGPQRVSIPMPVTLKSPSDLFITFVSRDRFARPKQLKSITGLGASVDTRALKSELCGLVLSGRGRVADGGDAVRPPTRRAQ